MTYPFFHGLMAYQNDYYGYMLYIEDIELYTDSFGPSEGDGEYNVDLTYNNDTVPMKFQHDEVYRGMLAFLTNDDISYKLSSITDNQGNLYEWVPNK